jgi:hypothetical protein
MRKMLVVIFMLIVSAGLVQAAHPNADVIENPVPYDIPNTDVGNRTINYVNEWTLQLSNWLLCLGVTHVCVGTYPAGDTLLWVSHGGASSTVTSDNWVLIFSLNTFTAGQPKLLDSFPQPTNSGWGWRDMCFLNGYVYAGYEGYINKIDPVTHAVVGTYAASVPSVIRALTDINTQDSIWSANFSSKIYKLWAQGGAPTDSVANSLSLYGLAYDNFGYAWGAAQNAGQNVVKYSYPSFTLLDQLRPAEMVVPGDTSIAGGCEMWRDSFLLYLGQCQSNDKVFCLRLYFPPPSQRDVGVEAIRNPGPVAIPNTPIVPIAKVQNYGSLAQTNFPVSCSIVGAGGVVRYTNTQTVATLAAGDTILVNFASWTPTIEEMCTVKMRTNLSNDSGPGNDQKTRLTEVTSAINIIIGTGTSGSATYWGSGYYAYAGHNAIYLQSEIGYYGPLTHIAYYKTAGTSTAGFSDVKIYMRHTSETVITAGPFDTTDFTLVYAGTFPFDAVGWMDVTLNTPFIYNNIDNLEVLVQKGPPAISSGYPSWQYTTQSPVYMNKYGYGSAVPVPTYLTYYRPNIRLALAPQVPPQKDVGVSAITSPGEWQFPNIALNPQARIKNYGAAAQTFPVVCSIVNNAGATRYTNTQNITLGVLGDTNVSFGSWTPTVLETLTIVVRTNLTNDTNPSNDRKVKMTRITDIAEIIIGTGTSASGTYLMYGYNAYAGSEAIFLQPEVGYYGNITNIAYYKGGGSGLDNVPDVRIFMKHTTESELPTGAYDTTGYELVFNDSFPNNQATGWMDVSIRPFLYNNQDNLSILILKGPPALGSGVYPTYRYTTQSPYYRNRYGYSNTGWPTSFTRTYYRMNVRLMLSPIAPPQKDVGVDAILAPLGVHMINTPMTPVARVKNYGAAAQTFPVVCSIIGPTDAVRYVNTQTVTNLAPGETTHVTFTAWTPTIAEMDTVIVRTLLANDSFPVNDCKTRTTTVGNVMLQSFEISNGGYVADPASGAWEWGSPTSGPNAAYSGTKLWATILSGNYTASANWKLTSDNFVAYTDDPVLQFMHWYDTEASYDGGNVKISTDHGANWTLITPVGGYSGTANSSNVGIPLEPCFTGHVQGFWEEENFVLDVDSGQTFLIRWHFGSDGSVYYPGWYVDDVVGINCGWTGITEEVSNDIINLTALHTAKPNPVKGMVQISFNLAIPTHTSLKIYDASGRIIRTLVNTNMERGEYNLTWNGKDDNNRTVAEGVYFYTLQTDNYASTKKLVLTR